MIRRVRLVAVVLALAALPALAQHQHGTTATPAAEAGSVPLFDNLGTYHHAITTTVPLAQRYFDQGLRLVYGFNHDEARRAFSEAARQDPECAMAYWGVALTLGPNYNLPMDPEQVQASVEAIQKAQSLAEHISPPERAYIEALAKRYSTDPGADRHALDVAYAGAMRVVAHAYPNDPDAATLFAEALMDLRPWDLWTHDGTPQPGTAEILSTLEAVLKKNPNHPGANHYYIHAVEASSHPERALPSAGRLPNLMPGAGHLVHMPSHIYMRIGRYADAADINARAAAVDRAYLDAWKPEGVYKIMYYTHNVQFRWAALMMEGRSADALQAAREVAAMVSPETVHQMPMAEFVVPTPLFSLSRFGKWEQILQEPAPPADLAYTTGMWHYARGLALARTGRLDEAARERDSLAAIAAATPPDATAGLNSAAALLNLAAGVLAGELAAQRGETDDAVRELEAAVTLQEGLRYDEPPPWYYPVRQSLGAVLLAAGRPRDAEAVYREDLKQNPENGWSLFGLAQCLQARRAKADAAAVDMRFKRAWAHADVTLPASRF